MAVICLSGKTPGEKIYSVFFRPWYPVDLILVVVWLAVSIVAIYLPFLNTTPLRIVLSLPVVLFIPGYCIIAALYPKNRDIELIERIALSFGLSIAVVPLIGFGLNFTPWGIRLDPLVISLSVFTLVMVLAAHHQRVLLPIDERFSIKFSEISGAVKNELFPDRGNRFDRLLNAILYLVIITAILITIFVFTTPKEGERYTEFFVLDENRTTTHYPFLVNTSQNYPIYIGVKNHEHRDITYTIETWMISAEFNNMTNTSQIVAMDPSDRLSFTLIDNETAIIPYTMSVKRTGYNRLEFLLFNESVPDFKVTGSDRINESYRDLHLWVTVRD